MKRRQSASPANTDSVYEQISLDRILDPERPLRSDLSPESVEDLVVSIRQVGIIEPLVVARKGKNYELIAGHRRLVAAEIAGLATAPCIIKEVKGLEAEILKLHENIARNDINPIDWANHLAYLKSHYELSIAKLSEILGVSDAWVSQHLDILNYPPELRSALRNDQIAFTAARELNLIKDSRKKRQYVEYAVKGGVSPSLAARWRKEANLPSYQTVSTQETPDQQQVGSENLTNEMTCPICGEVIPIEEAITLTVHHKCRPLPTNQSQ